jgi:hypothetical protein
MPSTDDGELRSEWLFSPLAFLCLTEDDLLPDPLIGATMEESPEDCRHDLQNHNKPFKVSIVFFNVKVNVF